MSSDQESGSLSQVIESNRRPRAGRATVVVTTQVCDYLQNLEVRSFDSASFIDTLLIGREKLLRSVENASPGAAQTVMAATPAELIDRIRRNELPLSHVKRVVAVVPHDDDIGFATDLAYILAKVDSRPELLIVSDQMISDQVLTRIPVRRIRTVHTAARNNTKKGASKMGKKGTYISRPDQLKKLVKDVIREIHDEADPLEMNTYRRFIKRNVSIFSRGYFTAYLLREIARRDGSIGTSRRSSSNDSRSENRAESAEERPVEGNVPPEKRQTLFVSVGKNRRVYPKDFLALFTEITEVDGEKIGQIKILDNYSFVEVDEEIADAIIGTFDGYEFRGRKLTVNYARNKK